LKFPEMMLFTCNWFQALDKPKYFEESGDHADEMETSLIMHLHPELVLQFFRPSVKRRTKRESVSTINAKTAM
jgi:creatinine amidohydrolase/Fe(II)-dependent formamide hydrolase-like protein